MTANDRRKRRLLACAPPRPVPARLAEETEHALLEILRVPVAGATLRDAFDHKEREIGEAFARLTPVEALVLHRRLANPVAGDELAAALGRLVVERRERLLSFLQGARRRAALAGAQRS